MTIPPRRILRYALVHVPLWVAVTLFVLFIYYDFSAPFAPQLLTTMFGVGMAALPTYYTVYRLVPRLLFRRRISAFIFTVLGIALLNSVANYLLGATWYHLMTGRPIFPSLYSVVYVMLIIYSTDLASITLGCALRIITSRFRMEEQLQAVEAEKVRTELAFLRAQVNPHFLFNVLNTIYFQIQKENNAARTSVEKLSELLRYQLYECTTDRLPIAKEIAYIRNYVSMQQLRLEPGTDVALNVGEGFGDIRIAPLLILPLVENAFKHISHFKNAAHNKLHITLRMEGEDWLVAEVINTFDPAHNVTHLAAAGGLGLQNVQRRLDLLYPGAHVLDVAREATTFRTILKIRCRD